MHLLSNIKLGVAMNKRSRCYCYNKASHTDYTSQHSPLYTSSDFFTRYLSILSSTIPSVLLQEADLLYWTTANPLPALKSDCHDLLNWCKLFLAPISRQVCLMHCILHFWELLSPSTKYWGRLLYRIKHSWFKVITDADINDWLYNCVHYLTPVKSVSYFLTQKIIVRAEKTHLCLQKHGVRKESLLKVCLFIFNDQLSYARLLQMQIMQYSMRIKGCVSNH